MSVSIQGKTRSRLSAKDAAEQLRSIGLARDANKKS